MIDVRDIFSLSDFQRNARDHIRRLQRTRRPEVLTVNGKAEVIVQDARAYQRLVAGRERPERSAGSQWDYRPDPDPVIEAYKEHLDRTLLRRNLERSVDERLEGLRALQRLAAEARRAGRTSDGTT